MLYQSPEITDQIIRRLTGSLADLSTSERRRITYDVRQAALGAFMRGRPARPTQIVKMLRKARNSFESSLPLIDDLDAELWPYLGIEDLQQLRRKADEPGALEKALDEAIEQLESDRATQIDRAGGRSRDDRIERFVISLAQIYRQYTSERPTTTNDTASGELRSHFDVFVLEAFRAFYPEGEVPQGSVRGAIREAVRAEKELETYLPSEDELPRIP